MSNPNREVATIDPRARTLRDLISSNLKAMASVLPTTIKPERMARVSLNAVTTIPKLLECNPNSFIQAMLECAVLGLEPGVAGQCWIIPYKGKATLVVGYKGMIQLAWRSAQLANIGAEAVYEKDGFEYEKYPPRLVHKPYRGPDRGKLIAAYAYARLQNGGEAWVVMEAHEIEAIKKRSAAVKTGADTPWNSLEDEHWMWRKTALRQLMKFLPMSVEVQRAVDNDERADAGLSQNFDVDLKPENEIKTGTDELNDALKGDGKPAADDDFFAQSTALFTQYDKQLALAKTVADVEKVEAAVAKNKKSITEDHKAALAEKIAEARLNLE